MDAIKKAERRKAMGETKKVPVRIDPKQWERTRRNPQKVQV